jgi:flavin-binding protein dodecin
LFIPAESDIFFYTPADIVIYLSKLFSLNIQPKEGIMTASVYKIIDLVGTSPHSWEEAANNAIEKASKSLRDLRIAEIGKLDMKVENGKVTAFRARVKLSFKYQGE